MKIKVKYNCQVLWRVKTLCNGITGTCIFMCLFREEWRCSWLCDGTQWRWHLVAVASSLSTRNHFLRVACVFTYRFRASKPRQHVLSQLNTSVFDVHATAYQLCPCQWSSETMYITEQLYYIIIKIKIMIKHL